LIKAVPDEQEGERMDCPRCGKEFTVVGRASSSKDKKGGSSAQTKSLKAQPYPPRRSLDATRKGEKEAEAIAKKEDSRREPVRAAVQRRSEPEEAEEEERSNSSIPWFVILGVVAFLVGSVGLALASFSGMEPVAVGVTLLGLVLAGIGFFVAYRQETGTLYPVLGIAVCLPALFWSLYCYSQMPKPEKPKSAAELAKKTTVPLNQRNAALSDEKPTTAQEDEFLDITRQAEQQGDLRVAVSGVSIAKAPLEGPPGKKPPIEKYLIVNLRLSNVGVERKYDYSGWGQWGGENSATLRDTKGKTFKLKRFEATWEIKGQVRTTAVFPGKTIDDILVFEAPPVKDLPSRLRLELPAPAVGGVGKFQFEISAKSISVTP
jgi:hypothetical protein